MLYHFQCCWHLGFCHSNVFLQARAFFQCRVGSARFVVNHSESGAGFCPSTEVFQPHPAKAQVFKSRGLISCVFSSEPSLHLLLEAPPMSILRTRTLKSQYLKSLAGAQRECGRPGTKQLDGLQGSFQFTFPASLAPARERRLQKIGPKWVWEKLKPPRNRSFWSFPLTMFCLQGFPPPGFPPPSPFPPSRPFPR